jgi:hypothetical protein
VTTGHISVESEACGWPMIRETSLGQEIKRVCMITVVWYPMRSPDILPIECIHYNAAKALRTTLLEESVNDLRANLEVRFIGKSENTHELASDV